ncbi:MAG: hypothetical protein A2W25_14190 [candidate division Zixibacteria bacterium RBG_16_53_22]|nr:MAG: hypothetical protein A2W25_14190 [candidate division Zixibacteria bacterium RBG_16_53_22]
MDIRASIRGFIYDNFMLARSNHELLDSDSLFDKGVIDSTGVLELVGFIEENFKIAVADEELTPDNLDTINNLVEYIQRKKGAPYANTAIS